MSTGFNMARTELFAKREGISFQEACSRLAKLGARRRRDRARQNACVNALPLSAAAAPGFVPSSAPAGCPRSALPAPEVANTGKRHFWWQNDD